MKTKLLLIGICCAALFSTKAMAQEEGGKEVVYIDYFSRTNDIGSSFAEALRNKVIEGIQVMDRVQLVDVDAQDVLKIEAERRKDASAVSDETARNAQMKSLGAQYVIKGHVASMNAVKRTDDKGKVSYKGSVSYSLKLIDTLTGALKATKTFSHEGITGSTGDTSDDAILKTCDYAKTYMEDFIDEYFKLQGTIVQIESVKKNKAEQVYIDLGTNRGIQKAQKFNVYIETDIAGEVSLKEIGKLNAKEVVSGKRTLCSVTKGGEEIKTASENNQKLVVISKKQTLFGGMF